MAAVLAAILGIIALTGACTGQEDAPQGVTREVLKDVERQLREEGYTEQADTFSDGELTIQERDAMFTKYKQCISAAGMELTEPQVNPVNTSTIVFLLNSGDMDQSAANASSSECNDKYWGMFSAYYSATHPDVMDVPLREYTVQCMLDQGYKGINPDGTNGTEILAEPCVNDQGSTPACDAISDCISKGVQELYPEIEAINITIGEY